MLKHCLNALFFPVLIAGFVFDIFASFFQFGQYKSTLWLNSVMRDSAAVAKAQQKALERAKAQFPGAHCRIENNCIVVSSSPPDDDAPEKKGVH